MVCNPEDYCKEDDFGCQVSATPAIPDTDNKNHVSGGDFQAVSTGNTPPIFCPPPPLPLSKINPDCIHLARNEFQCPLDRWAAVWNALHTANAMRSIPGVGGARDNRPGARNGGGRGLHVRHDANPLTIRVASDTENLLMGCQKRKNHGVFLNWKTLNKKNNEVLKSA